MKLILLSLILCSCLTKGIDYNEPIDLIIDKDGEKATLHWDMPSDKDITGFNIYYGEITDYIRTTPPDDFHLVNDLNKVFDAGYTTSVTFLLDKTKLYGFAIRAYNKDGLVGQISKTVYWPFTPAGVKVNLFTDPWHGYLYKSFEPIKLACDLNAHTTSYEWQCKLINDDNAVTTYFLGSSNLPEKTVSRPSGAVGLFEFFVRACNENSTPRCSAWTTSDGNNAIVTVNGSEIPGNWLFYWGISAPGGVVIE